MKILQWFQSYKNKSKLFSPSISTSDDMHNVSGSGPILGPSLSVGGAGSAAAGTPSLANLHSQSCGSPSFSKDFANSSEGSLKVAKTGKPINRWSGLWGSSSKVIWLNKCKNEAQSSWKIGKVSFFLSLRIPRWIFWSLTWTLILAWVFQSYIIWWLSRLKTKWKRVLASFSNRGKMAE